MAQGLSRVQMRIQHPSVAIIVRVMDRADELRFSLPSFLNQEYPDYHVVIVDHSSQDGLSSVLETMKTPRLRVVRCARPEYFNPSSSGNIGVRYSFSDLLFFLDTGIAFRDEKHLSEIVAAYREGSEIDHHHYKAWRRDAGYPGLEMPRALGDGSGRRVYCECECHGLHMLVSRDIFQRIGGLNEALLDWGYEDTDLATRLELCGYGRIPVRELIESKHDDELRVRFFRVKSKERSWTKNRLISDGFIRTFGPVLRTQRTPGLCEWVEIDGVSYRGADAPQQEWKIETVAELRGRRILARHSERNSPEAAGPLVSVVVPTKNAAEYLVGVLDSILSQDYSNIECLVVDGGSTDATLDILASYGDRITWTTQPDRGAFDAINRGWQTSRGQILAWLNADDSWPPGAVSAAVKCFQDDPEADVVYGDCLIIDAEGRELENRRPPDWDLGYSVETCHHVIDQPAAFIRRRIAEQVGWLYPAWFHDWDLWRRISLVAGGKIKRVPHLLGCARVRLDNSQYRPEVLISGLVDMTERFFSLPSVPADLQEVRRRAVSNCYLRIVQTLQYGRPESRGLRLKLCIKALAADPSNLPNVLKRRPAGRRPLPDGSREESHAGAKWTPQDINFPTIPAVEGTQSSETTIPGQDPPPTVSVVVPCKNDARYLGVALRSILCQDYPNLECIVVDGGSTDGTIDLLKQHGDRIRWLSEPDRGAFDAINRGWKLSKGEILTWLNADDLWEPGAVRTVVDLFERQPDVDVVYGIAGVVDELGRFLGELVPDTWDLECALRHCDHLIFQPASFMRRRILEEVGWLYPAWCHDHDLWLRIAAAGGTFARLSTRLAMDRMRPDNLGHRAEIVIPAKIGLTKRFFAGPGLPPKIQALRRRAMSSAYVRACDYLQVNQPGHWFWSVRLLAQAVVADPRNIRSIGERATRPFRWRIRLLFNKIFGLLARILALTTAVNRRLIRLGAFFLVAPTWWLGRVVKRVFTRANRDLRLEIAGLQRRVEMAEQAASSAPQPVATGIDGMAVDLSRLAVRMERDRRVVEGALESLRLQHEALRKEVTLELEDVQRRVKTARPAASAALQPVATRIDGMAVDLRRLEERMERDHHAVVDALQSLRLQHQALEKELEAARDRPPAKLLDTLREVYGSPPTLRPIPGWHTYWGVESGSDRFHPGRIDLWSSLKSPVLMRWFADLLVMIWPGNELSRVLFLTGNFEPSELTWVSQTLTKGMTIIDVGAHMGIYSMIASKLVGESGVIIALEPSTREFQRLAFHVTLNDLSSVRCLQVAASDSSGQSTLRIAWEWNSGHNTFGEFFSPTVEMANEEVVRTQTLDDVVAAQGLQRVDLIKIDVEGHELRVLAGAVETLTRFRPRVLIEVFGETLRRQGASEKEVLAFFQRHGYLLNEFSPVTGELVPLSQLASDESRNLVALPT